MREQSQIPKVRAWMKRLERVLLDAPPGIGIYTIGDADLTVYDKAAYLASGVDLCDGGAYRAGVVIGSIRSAVEIEGVPG